jgi:hypothetical protein
MVSSKDVMELETVNIFLQSSHLLLVTHQAGVTIV